MPIAATMSLPERRHLSPSPGRIRRGFVGRVVETSLDGYTGFPGAKPCSSGENGESGVVKRRRAYNPRPTENDMNESDPRAIGAPFCPSCRTAYGVDARMRGPVAAPTGAEPGRYFVCDRCNFSLRDRRQRGRVPL